MDEFLTSLLSKTSIPDLEFVSNLGDWPLSDKRTEPALPVISWCGSSDSNEIVIPTYELTESSLQMQVLFDMNLNENLNFNDICIEGKDKSRHSLSIWQTIHKIQRQERHVVLEGKGFK